jgi:murein DD-endopeptidase MepM/ murein hydrolase activator NlpD
LPEPARRVPRLPSSRSLPRAVAHLAVVGVLAFTAVAGFFAQHSQDGNQVGFSFDIVSTARGAGAISPLRSVQYELAGDPTNPDPALVDRNRIAPTAAPTPTPKPSAKPAPTRVITTPVVVNAVAGNGSLLWPVPGGIITQYFSAYHLAIDIATTAGNPVVAAASGTVVSAGWRSNGGGLVIEINHGNGVHTLYNHLGAILVSVGQVVSRGQRIASVGCTGNCTGPHVHFQVQVGGVFVNPLRYL